MQTVNDHRVLAGSVRSGARRKRTALVSVSGVVSGRDAEEGTGRDERCGGEFVNTKRWKEE